jgi:hypothetical protein
MKYCILDLDFEVKRREEKRGLGDDGCIRLRRFVGRGEKPNKTKQYIYTFWRKGRGEQAWKGTTSQAL